MSLTLGLRLGLGGGQTAVEQIITADTAPVLAALTDADTPADGFTSGTYSSSAGTISSETAVYFVDDAEQLGTFDLTAGEIVRVREDVVDSEANERSFYTSSQTVTPSVALSNSVIPAISGTAEIGETLTCSTGTWAGSASRTYAYQWTRDTVDISGATSSTYDLVAADDQTDVACDVTADDGFTQVTASANAVAVTYPAPVASGGLSNQSYEEDTGVETVDASTDFTGAVGGTWSVNSATGISINSSGVVSIDTATAGDGTITVTYTNSGGSDDSAFSLTITTPTVAAPAAGAFTAAQNTTDPQKIDIQLSGYTIPTGYTLRLYIGMVPFTTATSTGLTTVISNPATPFTSNAHPEWMDTTLYIGYGLDLTAAPGSFDYVTDPNKTLATASTVITQTATPTTAAIDDGDTVTDAFVSEGTYTASNSQTINTFVLATDAVFYVNGSPVAQSATVSAGDVVYFACTITASDDTTEVFNSEDIYVGAGTATPTLSSLVVTDATDTISINSDLECRLHYRLNSAGGDPDAATIIAGGGDDNGYVDLTSGSNSFPLTFTAADGTYQISFAAYILPDGDPSNVLRDSVTIAADTDLTDESDNLLTDESGNTLTASGA